MNKYAIIRMQMIDGEPHYPARVSVQDNAAAVQEWLARYDTRNPAVRYVAIEESA